MEIISGTVADLLGCSEVWLHKLRRAGDGPPYEKRRSRYHYSLGAVIRWVIARETRPLTEQIAALEAKVARLIADADPFVQREQMAERITVFQDAVGMGQPGKPLSPAAQQIRRKLDAGRATSPA